ncbi:MAG: acyl-CoA thioesterase [Proteobacteria bacterium]|nr:acyl-CoA thioesterase [Pseudomonadota bacterium]
MSAQFLIEVPFSLRWRDLDAFNHVNNSSFFTFLEESRLRWLTGLDGEWNTPRFMPVLAAANLNYRAQLSWPGEILVRLSCERLGNSSLTIAHRILGAGLEEALYCDGNTVMVWVDPATGKSVPLPEAVRRACA